MRIRKGDEVVVIAGKDKGKRGKVLRRRPEEEARSRWRSVNLIKKHTKPSQKHPQGGIVEKEGTIHISNVRLWDAKAGAPLPDPACKVLEDGKKARISAKTGETFA